MPGSKARGISLALLVAAAVVVAAWLDARYGWITPAFDAVAHQFYEVPILARVRRPSQLILLRWHLAIGSALLVVGLMLAPWLTRHGRTWLKVLGAGYALRAVIWICGGNLPLVPGDSCHYMEVATSALRGEGPVKHYVESFFTDYPRIREGRGVLDDWAPPLDAYLRAGTFRLAGVTPESPLETRFAVAKACSFVLNLLALPALYGFARRRFDDRVALGAMAALAILPVHAIYAGLVLRESLVALTSILAIWTLTEVWHAEARPRRAWALAVLAGACGGLAILARTTAMPLLGAAGLLFAVTRGRRQLGPLVLWAATIALVILPWALATFREYGSPFYTYTGYFEYNFSWAIHHYEKGNTFPSQFYTLANLPEILRVKVKSLLIIMVYSTMIVGLPIVLGFLGRLRIRGGPGRDVDLLVAMSFVVFVLATLKSIADVTQVAQLGRYYLPVFVLALPTAVAGLCAWIESLQARRAILPWLAAGTCALVWADPTWAYDASWFVKPFQLHWLALSEAGDWIRANPDRVPRDARVMSWFPWELRVTSDRTTVLMPRNYNPVRIHEVIAQYRVTHFLWGSFEPPPELDPEIWVPHLEDLRARLGLTRDRELFHSTRSGFYPVRLYRLK
ncbi:MAG TPA: glycosyltransferase family 39 protein [Isosphaeraceae bacterium]|nr:glycosyltransferase family 39 protein [Isosphaeraceae bacterium]